MSYISNVLIRSAVVVGLIAISACASGDDRAAKPDSGAAIDDGKADPPVGAVQQVAPGAIPQGISSEAWADIQRQIAQAQYEAAPLPSDADVVGAYNPRQSLRLRFTREAARFESLRNRRAMHAADEPAPLQLRTLAILRGTQGENVESVQPTAEGARIEYRRSGGTEWYVNTALGLEHGYTLTEAPASTDSTTKKPVRIAVAVSGMGVDAQSNGGLRFSDGQGRKLSYGKLVVNDAQGHVLPSQFVVTAADRFEIAFDDTAAHYPVTVDPLLINDEQTIPAPGDKPDTQPQQVGASVAIASGTLLVGAPLALGYGAVYVYAGSGSKWTLQQRLIASDASEEQQFGISVALSGDTALIGAPSTDSYVEREGAAYVFVRSGTSWTQQAEFKSGVALDEYHFGGNVALSGDTALVSAGGDDFSYASVYVRSGTSWTQQASLQGADQKSAEGPVAISGDTALVSGNPNDGFGCASKVYVFVRSGTQWTEQASLDPHSGCLYAGGLIVSVDTAVVGTVSGDSSHEGTAYVFQRSGTSWAQQAQLIATDNVAQSSFGRSVALFGDIVVVGAPLADVGANVDQGAAYVFQRAGTAWTQQAKLVAADGAAGDQFGSSAALDGAYAVVGAPLDDAKKVADIGSAYVFKVSSGTWSQKTRLSDSDGAYDDGFGSAVALSGDTALIGVSQDYAAGGAAYVFVRSESAWVKQAKLTSDATDAALFGSAVALSDETALIGAPFYSEPKKDHATGAAFVFVRSGTAWNLQAKLKAADAKAGNMFGASIALAGDTAIMGSPVYPQGAAYAFVRAGESWTQQAKFVEATRYFGSSVAVSGDTAMFVDPQQQDTDGRFGVVYQSQRSGTQWSALTRLTPTDPSHPHCYTVALLDDTALLGCDPVSSVFVRNGSSWSEQATLNVSTGLASFSGFGSAVALGGDTALVGAPNDTVESGGVTQQRGAAYLFTRVGSAWTQRSKLSDADGSADDHFGFAVALSGAEILVGAPTDNTSEGVQSGSAHFFRIGTDHGDAPAPYPTLLADKGARHFVDADGPLLGGSIDDELDGQPNSGATGDDIAGIDDETAVTFGKLMPGASAIVTVKVNGKFDNAQLDAWIDFNADGDWDDSGEQLCMQCAVVKGSNSLQIAVPSSATIGQTYARFRLSQTGTGKVKPTGRLVTGEVEDYIVKIKAP
jgi:hypothetical protein